MCNLYRLSKSNAEVARWFTAIDKLRKLGAAVKVTRRQRRPGRVLRARTIVCSAAL